MSSVISPSSTNSVSLKPKGQSQSEAPTRLSSMSRSDEVDASAVLIMPIYDERQQGADLVMLPIFDDDKRSHQHQQPQQQQPAFRTETPAAPTPPPKPQLPEGCQDWDHYLSQKKSTATLPILDPEQRPPQIRSPELNFNHTFDDWRDCLTRRQPRRRPSAATVIPTLHGSSAVSIRLKRLSTASTVTTAATVPIMGSNMSIRSKRLSNASTLTTSTMASTASGKPRSLRRINRTRHLRAYYSDGSLLRSTRVVGVSLMPPASPALRIHSMHGIVEGAEDGGSSSPPSSQAAEGRGSRKRLSSVSSLASEHCAPPPYPPPNKPLPSLPVVEVRELQTGERTRWREVLLRSFQRREAREKRRVGVACC